MSLHRKARPHDRRKNPKAVGRCPKNGKVSWRSRKDALRFAATRTHLHSNGRAIPYRCDCGDWHLTSRKRKEWPK